MKFFVVSYIKEKEENIYYESLDMKNILTVKNFGK